MVTRINSLMACVGRTPLLRMSGIDSSLDSVELYGKAEWLNPSGSVKDRAATFIVDEAERSGRLRPGGIILDATSGNTGISYAMIGAARGYGVRLCIPGNASDERKKILRACGADLVITDPLEGGDGAVREAIRIHASDPDRFFYADQYNNPMNWRAHYETTGPEILEQTEGVVTHFVAGIGTSGTLVGTGRYLREHDPTIRVVAVQPDSPMNGLEGMKHLATSKAPGIYDPGLADEVIEVPTEEAYEMVRLAALREGILVGPSSGANLVAALRVAKGIEKGVVVTILCDSGLRYLSESFWNEHEIDSAVRIVAGVAR